MTVKNLINKLLPFKTLNDDDLQIPLVQGMRVMLQTDGGDTKELRSMSIKPGELILKWTDPA